jgi:hypothetical protein
MINDLLTITKGETNFELHELSWKRAGFTFVWVGENWRERIKKEIILISFLTHRNFA